MFLISLSGTLSGQNILKTANNLYKKKEFCKAINFYNQYLGLYSNKDIFFRRGVCHYYCRNLDMAIEDIENSIILGNLDKETNLYLAKSWQDKQEFEKAINYYKLYLVDVFKNDFERNLILDQIKRCSNGVYHKFRSTDHFIENWGSEMNSLYNDILPLQSPVNNSLFYFASDRVSDKSPLKKYCEYSNDFYGSNWGKYEIIPADDPKQSIIFLDLFKNQKKFLFFQGPEKTRGTIFSGSNDNRKAEVSSRIKFDGPIRSEQGFNDLAIINDSTFVFSSDMQGGYGGYDLYITVVRNGSWYSPVNLGPVINTGFDEISPFITPDGNKLFYSSNNSQSIGGYDVFFSEFSSYNNNWSIPKNLGLPINSTRDEIYFKVLNSGLGAIFSSDRHDQGFGGFDNYWLYFKNPLNNSSLVAGDLPFISKLDFKLIGKTDEFTHQEKDPAIPNAGKPTESVAQAKDTVKDKEPQKEILVNNPPEIKTKQDTVFFQIPMIYFREDQFSDNDLLIKFLDRLALLMMKDKNLKVEFVGNAYSWKGDKQDLVRSARMAQRLCDSMQLRMINKSRINVKGSGYSFPYAKTDGPERSKNIIVKANNRIDVYLHNFDPDYLLVRKEEMFLNRTLLDTRHTLYETIIDGLTYRVQMKSGNFLVLADNQSDYNDAIIEYDPVSGIYTYTVGIYKEYRQAKPLLDRLLENYHTNSIILPYINGLKIEKNDVIQYAKDYNDLLNYLSENQ